MPRFLHKMAAYGELADVVAMLEDGHDPDERDESGRTPLMYAADGGHIGVLRALLDGGADVNAVDDAGRTALMYAVPVGSTMAVEMLIEAGANANAADELGATALHEAVERNYVYTVELLTKAGASTSLENGLSETPLSLAEETLERYKKIVRVLKAARRREQSGRGHRAGAERRPIHSTGPGPQEIAPSTFVCRCGQRFDFSEGVVSSAKRWSKDKPLRLATSERPQHTIVFFKGKLDEIVCPLMRPAGGGPAPSKRKGKGGRRSNNESAP